MADTSDAGDQILFDNTTIADVVKSMVSDYNGKQEVLNQTIEKASQMVTTLPDAIALIPRITELMGAATKEKDVMVKLIGVLKKPAGPSTKVSQPALPPAEDADWQAALNEALKEANVVNPDIV